MRRFFVIVACLLLLVGCGTNEGGETAVSATSESIPDTTSEIKPTPTREPARDFTLNTLDGDEITLSDYQGEWVIVNFWATWCPPCIAEMPYLQSLAEDRGLNVLGVNFNEPVADIESFVVQHGITFPILLDPDNTLIISYGARSLPRTFVIDPEGNIALNIIGTIEEERLDAWLDEQDVN